VDERDELGGTADDPAMPRKEEVVMRTMATAMMAVAWLAIGASAGEARTYPWCATYNDTYGSRNCGFSTFQQCLATVSGIGGFCGQNPLFQPGFDPAPRRKPRRYQG
jgi:uncharacterized protein DUF3551